MEIEKKENQEPEAEVPEVIFSDALPFQIVVNNKNRTYELVFDNEKASSVPGTFAMMILLREKFQNLLLQEKSNVALVSQGELNPKYVMSKTLYNKHLHAIELLSKYILQCSNSKEFFIQKAIGWALREYSKTNAIWVQTFVATNTLAPLSKREALKRITA